MLLFAIIGIAALKFTLNFFRLIGTLVIFRIFRRQPNNLAQYCPLRHPYLILPELSRLLFLLSDPMGLIKPKGLHFKFPAQRTHIMPWKIFSKNHRCVQIQNVGKYKSFLLDFPSDSHS